MAVSIVSPSMTEKLYLTADLQDLKIKASSETVVLTVSCKYRLQTTYKQVFQSTYYPYGNSLHIYDISDIIEQYMLENEYCTLATVQLSLVAGSDTASYELQVIRCKRRLNGQTAFAFSWYNFLTNTPNRVVPSNDFSSVLYYFVHSVPRMQECEINLTMRLKSGELTTYTRYFTEENDVAGVWEFPADYGSLISDERFTFPYEDGDPVAYTIRVGNRKARFYIADFPHGLKIRFSNCFNLYEDLYLPVSVVQKTTTKQSLAETPSEVLAYDVQHTDEFECETMPLTIEHAHQVTEMLQSPLIKLQTTNAASNAYQIIITDYTADVSDNTGTSNKIKFTFRLADKHLNSQDIIADIFDGIFTSEYKEPFE